MSPHRALPSTDIVALHGWGLSSRVWLPLAEQLGPRLHALDLPGHGERDLVHGLDAWVDAIAAEAPDSAVYLGWSLGGLVAWAMAMRYPDRVRGLILTAATPRLMHAADWPWGMAETTLHGMRAGLDTNFSTTLHQFIDQQVRGTPDAASAAARLKADLGQRPPDRDGLEAGLDIIAASDLRDALPGIDVPSLLIAGERDRLAHPRAMQAAAEAMPKAHFVEIERAAHAPFVSHQDEFAALVTDFIDRIELH
ncbi:pimeloyl-ACP methyl ester esterase BioH [Salinisphaera sp. SPP-AMP-43]|uniref:pimeloyl-ACP methyl ester esterase BioH n=1 Tax=Salinisphaera sp. SPP-AMP-43 TaxID=3121288 RepID=UPI003C6E2CD4